MFRNSIIYLLIFFFLTTLSACSVGMAMSGDTTPNLGLVKVGATSGEIGLALGPPVKTVSLQAGRRADSYQYEIGNEPSGGRAIGHALMDVFTLGIWEIVGTPIEAFQGDTLEVTIIYDKNDRVEKINQATKVSPSTPTTIQQACNAEIDSCI